MTPFQTLGAAVVITVGLLLSYMVLVWMDRRRIRRDMSDYEKAIMDDEPAVLLRLDEEEGDQVMPPRIEDAHRYDDWRKGKSEKVINHSSTRNPE